MPTLTQSSTIAAAPGARDRCSVPVAATHGPITRLMSPSDFGEILKPFVFLDLFGP